MSVKKKIIIKILENNTRNTFPVKDYNDVKRYLHRTCKKRQKPKRIYSLYLEKTKITKKSNKVFLKLANPSKAFKGKTSSNLIRGQR